MLQNMKMKLINNFYVRSKKKDLIIIKKSFTLKNSYVIIRTDFN